MTNKQISRLFADIAAAYSIKDEKKYRFQILAYQKAATTIEHFTHEIQELFKENKLATVPGIGASIKSHIEELLTTGKVTHFEKILQDIPQAMFPLLDIPSFGPKKAYKLVTEFKLTDPKTVMHDLLALAEKNTIADLPGFGQKSQQDIIQAINEYKLGKTKAARMVLPYANTLAKKMIEYLEQCPEVLQASTLGSLRRKRATVGDIDIAVATTDPKTVLDHFTAYPHKERIIERGDKTSSILISSGKQIDLMTQPPEAFGSLLQHFTGSKEHNVRLREFALSQGLSLSEYGIKKKHGEETKLMQYQTEESFYEALGMQWVPPEMRENTGEIELARNHKLPDIVTLADIKGDFHLHSSYPIEPSHDMGKNSMEEMIDVARERGYSYLGFSEHNPSVSKHTQDETRKIIEKRKVFIDKLNEKFNKDIRVFSLLETDILPSGKLAIDDDSLELLDATIVSIHSVFDMDRQTMTERVLTGLSHPKAKILSHPTGRLLNQRPGYDLDWEKIFAFCKKHHKALEVNAFPNRLDLPDAVAREAIKQGVMLVIDTDSHAIEHMTLMEYGVSVARRAWATKSDILNALPYNEVEEWFRKGGE